jgi:L-arabinonolactonase
VVIEDPMLPTEGHEHAATLAIDSRCVLGEGILWHEQHQLLLWTDIQAARLWVHSPLSADSWSIPMPSRLASFALGDNGTLLLGLEKGLYSMQWDPLLRLAAPLELLVPVEENEPRTRVNDGRCDRSGRFVFGTMNEDGKRAPVGSFYQYCMRRGLRRLSLDSIAIANSICFSLDGATLYFCDSLLPRILCCDYDSESAQVANIRTFTTIVAPASADGSIIDAAGYLWNAQWGAGRVVRYAPNGELDRSVRIPAVNPTCVALGGPGFDVLYVTTARQGLDAAQLDRVPESGGVYRFDLQQFELSRVRGLPESRLKVA